MIEKIVPYDELSEMAINSFQSGLRLHLDSIIMVKHKSYASATLLSVLSMEEFGKYFSLSAYVFYTSVNDTRNAVDEEKYLEKLYIHPFKQSACFGGHGFEVSEDIKEKVKNKYYENLKQRAAYVGYERIKGKINLNKRFHTPKHIGHKTATQQVIFLNNLLIELVEQRVNGFIEMDEEKVNRILNERLLKKLRSIFQ